MRRPKILIIEDEVAIACDIAFNLEDHGYIIAEVFHSAEDGLAYLEKNKVDLVMLDINLEGDLTGIDVARYIDKELGIPFIFLTSYSDADTVNKAAHTFPSGYLVKPFKEDDLAPAVQMALIKKQGAKNSRLPSLTIINQELLSKITQGEYAVIEELWNGKSNEEIAKELFISNNTVKTHIRNIYSKLEVHSKPDLIRYLREKS